MTASPDTLKARMVARVNAARRAVDRRESATRPRLQRGRVLPPEADAASLDDRRTSTALRQVFSDLGTLYRRYRKRNGGPVPPELRAATDQFRTKPSLRALVAVAAILDELDLLG